MDAEDKKAVTKNSVEDGRHRKGFESRAAPHRSFQRFQRYPSVGSLFSRQDYQGFQRCPSAGSFFLSHQYPFAGESGVVNITIDQNDQFQPTLGSPSGTVLEETKEGDKKGTDGDGDGDGDGKGYGSGGAAENGASASPAREDAKEMYRNIYLPLYQAAFDGNWETAKYVFEKDGQAHSYKITRGGETVLHIAATTRHAKFLEELVKLMDPQDLEIKSRTGNTALCFAAASANVTFAKLMVDKNENLPDVRGAKNVTPLYFATLFGHRDMARYLFSVTNQKHLKTDDYIGIFFAAIGSNLYDVALDVLGLEPSVLKHKNDDGEIALHVLARKPAAFKGRSQQGYWRRCICLLSYFKGMMTIEDNISVDTYAHKLLESLVTAVLKSDDSEISDLITDPASPIFVAAKSGNVEFLIVLMKSYPDIIWTVDDKNRSIFHIAVMYRQKRIFNLIYQIGACKDMVAQYKDENRNNMLHLAAKLAPQTQLNKISGAALQMQQELIWFKEVEKVVPPSFMEMKNSEGVIPPDLFTKEHASLMAQGELWMKDTANSCMVVATLITTVMFAAAFTIPGGINGDTGSPIYLKEISFMVFAISDALSLFSSATSILMFLSILTSRYTETGFLISLPIRLIIGLATLFFSIATMMVAFSATFFIVLHRGLALVALPVATLACVPVILFAFLQFPLFVDMIRSTYKAAFFFRKHAVKKHM